MLIADDDSAARSLLSELLAQDLGCSVTEVGDGLEALVQLNKQRYTLLLLDMHMPSMGGLETLRKIRQSTLHSSLPVVMVTGVSDAAEVQKAVKLGIADYIVKPLDPAQIGDRLAGVLESQGPRPTKPGASA